MYLKMCNPFQKEKTKHWKVIYLSTLRRELERSGTAQGEPAGAGDCNLPGGWRSRSKARQTPAAATTHWCWQPEKVKIMVHQFKSRNLNHYSSSMTDKYKYIICLCVFRYTPWWAILFGWLEVLLQALVVLDLSWHRDRQRVTMVTTIITSQDLHGSENGKERRKMSRQKGRKYRRNYVYCISIHGLFH